MKRMGLALAGILGTLLVIGFLFITFSPEFGGKPTDEQQAEYAKTGHFEDGKFFNLIETNMDMGGSKMLSTMWKFFTGVPNSKPDFEVPVLPVDSAELEANHTKDQLIWFGHSAFLLQLDDKTILIDPMFGDVPAPHPMLGNGRYHESLPLAIEKMPKIDAVLISHDHYDHLDYGSITKLKEKTDMFYVPLGVSAHLKRWGIPDVRIKEMDWWDKTEMEGVQLAFTPSRHFSGRGLTDRYNTLWGSWVIKGDNQNIYFSGDGGYGPHFKEIGNKYGPFDFAMMECGQYNENWADIHMMPEETAVAGMDVQAKLIMPIHWGAFTLALHSWTDPIERVTAKAQEIGQPLIAPQIGEPVDLAQPKSQYPKWWLPPVSE